MKLKKASLCPEALRLVLMQEACGFLRLPSGSYGKKFMDSRKLYGACSAVNIPMPRVITNARTVYESQSPVFDAVLYYPPVCTHSLIGIS